MQLVRPLPINHPRPMRNLPPPAKKGPETGADSSQVDQLIRQAKREVGNPLQYLAHRYAVSLKGLPPSRTLDQALSILKVRCHSEGNQGNQPPLEVLMHPIRLAHYLLKGPNEGFSGATYYALCPSKDLHFAQTTGRVFSPLLRDKFALGQSLYMFSPLQDFLENRPSLDPFVRLSKDRWPDYDERLFAEVPVFLDEKDVIQKSMLKTLSGINSFDDKDQELVAFLSADLAAISEKGLRNAFRV